jgi:hypothetical protein
MSLKEYKRQQAKASRDYIKSIGREEYERQREHRKWEREYAKREREANRDLRGKLKREKEVLTFMLKNDVLYYHHNRSESMMEDIEKALNKVKIDKKHQEYDPYIWNRQGEGNNYIPLCQFGNIFSNVDGFGSIYEVPLDGTYKFYIYDSGQRGLGSFNYITAKKVEQELKVPHVNSGGFPPITV